MKKHIFIFLLFSLIAFANGQNEVFYNIVEEDYISTSSKRYSSEANNLPDEIIGSPYKEDTFQTGNIYENNSPLIEGLFFRYNVYKENIEIKNNISDTNSEILILKKSSNIIVKIKNQFFIYDEEIDGYYCVVFIGNNYKLYKKLQKVYYKPKRAQSSFKKDILATYKDKSSYFLVNKEGNIYKMPSSKKKKIMFFGNKKSEIEKYIKNYNLDINEEDILIKVVRYFDSFNDASLK